MKIKLNVNVVEPISSFNLGCDDCVFGFTHVFDCYNIGNGCGGIVYKNTNEQLSIFLL